MSEWTLIAIGFLAGVTFAEAIHRWAYVHPMMDFLQEEAHWWKKMYFSEKKNLRRKDDD